MSSPKQDFPILISSQWDCNNPNQVGGTKVIFSPEFRFKAAFLESTFNKHDLIRFQCSCRKKWLKIQVLQRKPPIRKRIFNTVPSKAAVQMISLQIFQISTQRNYQTLPLQSHYVSPSSKMWSGVEHIPRVLDKGAPKPYLLSKANPVIELCNSKYLPQFLP